MLNPVRSTLRNEANSRKVPSRWPPRAASGANLPSQKVPGANTGGLSCLIAKRSVHHDQPYTFGRNGRVGERCAIDHALGIENHQVGKIADANLAPVA